MTGYWETQLAAARNENGMRALKASPRTGVGRTVESMLKTGVARRLTDSERQIVQKARAHFMSDREFASAIFSSKDTIKKLLDGEGAMKLTADRIVACSKMIVKQAREK